MSLSGKGLPTDSLSRRLPKRFPVGAKYVVEGRVVEGHGGEDGDLRVLSRYVVLPGGRRINVLAEFDRPASSRAPVGRRDAHRKQSQAEGQSGQSGRPRKKFAAGGTD